MLRGFFSREGRLHTADPGGSAGGTTGGTTSGAPATSEGEGKNTGAATGQVPAQPAPSGDGKTPAAQPASGDKVFSQADVNRMIEQRLAEEKERETKRTQEATRKTKEEALKSAGEWQTLAEQRATELASLQGASERAEAYAKSLNDLIKDQIADWPDEVKALDPGKDHPEARLVWLKNSRALVERLKQAPKAPNTEGGAGNAPPTQPPGTQNGSTGATPPANQQQQPYRFQNPGDVKW